jgi:uncharacterized protein (TIGR02001 family)
MKKVVLSVVAALAFSAAPALAADMPVKVVRAPAAPVEPPSPFDIAFGTAFSTDYIFRGISQTDRRPAVQGYFELDYKAADWLTLYAGLWGSNVNFADAEFDITGGGRFSIGNFGLDIGYLYYEYPNPYFSSTSISFGEVYFKPSYKIADWLTVGGAIIGGNDFGNLSQSAWYFAGNATLTLPAFMPFNIGTSISGEVGRQTFDSTLTSASFGFVEYTTWNVGVAFNYKAATLDLRYFDTDIDSTSAPVQCLSPTLRNLCAGVFVATLKFDTTLSAIK